MIKNEINEIKLSGRWFNNKRIKETESLQKRLCAGSKNLVIEIEKLIDHLSAAKKRIKTGIAITFLFLYTKPMNLAIGTFRGEIEIWIVRRYELPGFIDKVSVFGWHFVKMIIVSSHICLFRRSICRGRKKHIPGDSGIISFLSDRLISKHSDKMNPLHWFILCFFTVDVCS